EPVHLRAQVVDGRLGGSRIAGLKGRAGGCGQLLERAGLVGGQAGGGLVGIDRGIDLDERGHGRVGGRACDGRCVDARQRRGADRKLRRGRAAGGRRDGEEEGGSGGNRNAE